MTSPALLCLLSLLAAATPAAPAAPPAKAAAPGAKGSGTKGADVPLPPPPAGAALVPSPPVGQLPPTLAPPPAALAQLKASGKARRIAVPDVKVQGDLPPRQLALFESALLTELRKLDGLSAIGMSEIREMLSYEYQRQMMGCSSDESCLAEIGGALGTDEMLQGTIVVEGKTATLTLKRIDMRYARVVQSDERRLTRANGEELLGAVGPTVLALFPDRGLREGRTRGVDKAVALRLNPPPLPRWVFFTTAGAAVAAGTAGVVYGAMAKDATQQFNTLAARSLTESVSGNQLQQLESTATSRADTANLFYATAGVLAVAAGVEAFFTDWHGYGAALTPTQGGAAITLGGQF